MGFCLFNNVAVTAAALAEPGRAGADRRLRRPPRQRHPGHLLRATRACSTCRCTSGRCTRAPGALDEIGRGRRRRARPSTCRSRRARPATSTCARRRRGGRARWSSASAPTWLLVSAGFDAHRADPLTGLGLSRRRLRRPHRARWSRSCRAGPAARRSSRAATTSRRCATRRAGACVGRSSTAVDRPAGAGRRRRRPGPPTVVDAAAQGPADARPIGSMRRRPAPRDTGGTPCSISTSCCSYLIGAARLRPPRQGRLAAVRPGRRPPRSRRRSTPSTPADTERIAVRASCRRTGPTSSIDHNEADFAYSVAGLGRFRVNVYRQRGSVGLVLRRVLPGHPVVRGARPAARRAPPRRGAARPRARHRPDRLGQDDDHRRDDRPHQRDQAPSTS